MGDDPYGFFLVLGVCKENMEGGGKMRKDAKLSSTVPSITLKTSKNHFAIFISLALRHEKRNKTQHKSEKKEQLLVAQQIEVLKRGKKEKRKKNTKKKTPLANYVFICQLRSLKPAVFRIILWLPLLKEMGTLGF